MNRTSHNRVVLTRELPGDLDTPVGAYLKLANSPYTYLLESVQGGERFGRYSFIGLPSREVLRVYGRRAEVRRDGKLVEQTTLADPLPWLREYAARYRVRHVPGLPRLAGGLVGYFGYDCVRYFEPKLVGEKPDPLGTPDILLMRSDELVVFDNLRATLTLCVQADPASKADLKRAEKRLDAIEAALRRPLKLPARRKARGRSKAGFVSGFSQQKFHAAVDRIKEYIAAGDAMQVVPSQRLSAPFKAPAVALYRAIRRLNPSPYLFYLHLDDPHSVGSSPEPLVRVEDGAVTVRPIAGTRRRGETPQEDKALEEELLADPKERAEHLMLLDLGRNDVGRVAKIGSVNVTDQFFIERYSQVMHIVSNVEGRLAAPHDSLDALAAGFPAGTVSGAPKVRAMEIIDELEKEKRGLYAGCVGYFSAAGEMDTCIVLRTALIKDGTIYVQAGAGIVADSNPASEQQECINKAKALFRAAEEARRFASAAKRGQ